MPKKSRKTSRADLLSFCNEARESLPLIERAYRSFASDASKADDLFEAFRLTHTITGASSMVGQPALSKIASYQEEVLESVASGDSPMTPEAEILLVQTSTLIAESIDGLASGEFDGERLLAEATRAYRRYKRLPEHDDDAIIAALLAELSGQPKQRNRATERGGGPAEVPAANESAATDENIAGPEAPAKADSSFVPMAVVSLPAVELDDLDSIGPELLEVFSQEAEDHLRNIYTALGELQQRSDDRESLRMVRQCAHTLKGAAGAVKLRCVTQLAHRMEDLLDELYDGGQTPNPDVLRLLYSTTDALDDLSKGKYEREAMQAAVQTLFAQYAVQVGRPAPAAIAAATELPEAKGAVIDIGDAVMPAPQFVVARAGPRASSGKTPKRSGEVVRVPVERLDELVRLVSELVINRTGFEQRMAGLVHEVEEHRRSLERIKKISSDLETHFEVSELGGRRLSGQFGPASNRIRFFTAPAENEEFDELELDRYTKFHLLSRSLAETTGDIGAITGELHNLIGDFDALLLRQSRLSRDIQDKLMRIRMLPLSTLSSRLQRAVRSVAQEQGKLVDLILEDEHIELDKSVLDEMSEAFLHLLRNAVDHGVEPPAERAERGKPELASIRVRAAYEGTQVVIEVADDGRGLDPAALRAAAARSTYAPAADLERMSDADLFQLIFEPGFSTSADVSEVSGRGVGMDIVRTVVHRLKGTLAVASSVGRGTTFTIRLPMTLAITRALMVKANTELFAVPVQAVSQILRIEREKVENIGQEAVIRAGGNVCPVMRLGDLLQLKHPPDDSRSMLPVLLINVGAKQMALVVDQLVSNREIVVKTLGNHLRRVHGLIGATLLGDGTVVPILDPIELVQEPAPVITRPAPIRGEGAPSVAKEPLSIMIVDDSVSVRRVVSNLIKNEGWTPVTARDGLDALEMLQKGTRAPDLILLDIEMPRMDGYELLATLRAQETFRGLPVVMVTSRAGEKHRKKALDLGATDYVVKPYEDEALLALIRRLARKSKELAHT